MLPDGIPSLVPVRGIRAKLLYDLQEVDGAMRHPFLTAPTVERLHAAQSFLREKHGGRVELLLWDAYRTAATQRAIFNAYRDNLRRQNPGFSQLELDAATRTFVSSPEGAFPHGVGAAVDVTLLIDGQEAWMGTGFDEFSARGGLARQTYGYCGNGQEAPCQQSGRQQSLPHLPRSPLTIHLGLITMVIGSPRW